MGCGEEKKEVKEEKNGTRDAAVSKIETRLSPRRRLSQLPLAADGVNRRA